MEERELIASSTESHFTQKALFKEKMLSVQKKLKEALVREPAKNE